MLIRSGSDFDFESRKCEVMNREFGQMYCTDKKQFMILTEKSNPNFKQNWSRV